MFHSVPFKLNLEFGSLYWEGILSGQFELTLNTEALYSDGLLVRFPIGDGDRMQSHLSERPFHVPYMQTARFITLVKRNNVNRISM